MFVCVCTWVCMWVCLWVCVEAKRQWRVFPSAALCLLSWDKSPPIQRDQLSSKLQGPSCLCLPRARAVGTHHHGWLLCGCWRSELGLHACWQALYQLSCPPPRKPLLLLLLLLLFYFSFCLQLSSLVLFSLQENSKRSTLVMSAKARPRKSHVWLYKNIRI